MTAAREVCRRAGGMALAVVATAALAAAWLAPAGEAASPSGPAVALELPVTATDLMAKPANNSPLLVADPSDPNLVLLANRRDSPDFSCGLQASGDGGRRWFPAAPVRRLPAGVDRCYAPEIAFDRHSSVYYLFVGLEGAGNRPVGAFLSVSRDRGRTFGPARRVLGPGRYGVRMAIDPDLGRRGRLHLAWIEAGSDQPTGGFAAPPNPVMAAYSDDAGATFSAPVRVSDPARRVVAPVLALGAHHRVHIGYYDLGADAVDYQGLEGPVWDGLWSLRVSTSHDGGRSFGPASLVDGAIVAPERVMLVYTMPPASLVADGAGRLYAAWHDARNHDWDVFVRRSDDARRWAPAVRVNDDPVGNGHHQYLPRLSVSAGGRVDVVFYDRRLDFANRATDVYYTYSSDHGRSFAPNTRLSRISSDPEIGPQYGVVSARGKHEFGGRLGLVSTPSGAVAAWTDTRNTFFAPPAQDIFATTVHLARQPPARHGQVIGGTGIAAVAVVGAGILRRRRARPVEATGGGA